MPTLSFVRKGPGRPSLPATPTILAESLRVCSWWSSDPTRYLDCRFCLWNAHPNVGSDVLITPDCSARRIVLERRNSAYSQVFHHEWLERLRQWVSFLSFIR